MLNRLQHCRGLEQNTGGATTADDEHDFITPIVGALEQTAHRSLDKQRPGARQGETLTYRQLNARANQLAHHLQRQGVGPETLVGLCVEWALYHRDAVLRAWRGLTGRLRRPVKSGT